MNIWHDVSESRIKPEDFLAVIEITRGDKKKYELDKETGCIILDRILYTSMQYPANYGFIPSTLDGDGDCLDCYIIGDTLPVKSVAIVYPRLCIDCIDHDGQDYKIISTLDPYLSDEEVMMVAEAICRAMGLQITAIQDKEFAMRVIEVCSVK